MRNKSRKSAPAARRAIPGTAEEFAQIVRRYNTAVILFHHAVAELLGVGPTDLQCLDLLREREGMTGSELAAITGLTTGAISGVVARLERAGYLRRKPDRRDGRKQTLYPEFKRIQAIHLAFEPVRTEMRTFLQSFNARQLNTISEFLARSTELAYRHAALLRSDAARTKSTGASSAAARPAR